MDKILIVDDSEMNRDMLSSIFEDKYEILEAGDGEEACKLVEENINELVIVFLDIIMPKKNGLEVLAHMRYKGYKEAVPVVMITGEGTDDTDMQAYEYGADDVIYKPFASKVVTRRALNLIEQYKQRNRIEAELASRNLELMENQKHMENMNEFLLKALGSVVEFRSLESGEHVRRVMTVTKVILNYVMSFYPKYELNPKNISLMSQAAALHDVGKIGIPDEILNAPRRLTADEYDRMKLHTTYGCEILENFRVIDNEFYKYCYDICRWHHEKVDGKGYPDGLVGDQIPIYCQVASIADCFDALVNKRVYKGPVSIDEAYNMIINGECGQFSSAIIDCFNKAREELEKLYLHTSEGDD